MSATPPDSPYASREHSPNRSRSPSPSRSRRDTPNRNKSFGILERILEVLYDIVQNDCRYKVITPRPFRPPNALQSIVLDIAHLLVDQNPYSPGWLYELGMAIIPGFNFFNDILRARLLIFYTDFLIPHLMACQREFISDDLTSAYHGKSNGKITMNGRFNLAAPSHSPRSEILLNSDADILDDEHSFYRRQSAARKLSRRLSISYTGDLDIDAYYIDSMFTPLLYSIMQFISVENSSLETLYQMHRTIEVMVQNKPDLYNDVIEIIAHGDTISRNQAVNILFYFWRNSTGHLSIGEALPSVGYMHDLLAKEKKNDIQANSKSVSKSVIKDVHNHQFLPHIFIDIQDSKDNNHASITGTSIADMHGQFIPTEHPHACVQCFKPVSDFGLRCGGCKLNVHFTCYNLTDGGCLAEYLFNSGVQKLSTPRYCDIARGSREVICNDTSKNNNFQTVIISETVAGHTFRLANFFTLVLCIVCRMPLWGVMHQGYRCETCNKFIHLRCMKSGELKKQFSCQSSPMNENDALIERDMLCLSFKAYYENILIPEENLSNYSFEELSIMMTILQMQENILRNGIMAGCLIIKQKYHNPLSPITEPFERFNELQEFLELYRSYLGGRKASLSVISSEYWEGIGKEPPLWLISCEDYLAHLASIIKSSDDSESEFVDRHLSVYTAATLTASSPEYSYNSTGILTIKEIMKWLRKNLGFHSSYASKMFLQQMANYGFLERINGHPVLFNDESEGKQLGYDVTFPLPFVIECSPTVESLITAISACLLDISISTNECGLLLMTRRCWPDSFSSRYVLERLIYAVIKWVCDEDDKLLIIAREYTPSHLKLPGVRDEMEDKRGGANQRTSLLISSSAGGGAYIICRKMLREKYIMNWMSAIHDMNQGLFCDIVFDQIEMLDDNKDEEDVVKETELQSHDRILKFMIRLWHAGLLFSAVNDMIARWLDDAYHIMKHQSNIFVELKTLYKTFNVSKSSMQRYSTTDQMLSNENYGEITDPIVLLTQLFKGDAVELTRALQWMEVMVRSGVGLPGSMFSDFLPYLANLTPSIEQYVTFMEVMWYQVMNGLGQLLVRSNIQKIILDVNELAFEMVQKINEEGYGTEIASARSFIKVTLALSLYSYSCPLEMIYNIGIFDSLPEKPISLSQHKRLSNLKDSTPGSNITADNPLMLCLLKYARLEKLEVRGDIVKGFWRFYTSAGLIFNKNEFINSCIPKLLPSVWEELSPLYDLSSDMTLQLLMRIVWADSGFFLASVSKVFEHSSWEVRFDGLDNLYGLFSKLEERHEIQRAGVFTYLGPIFSYFVGCLWDEEEFVRTKAISCIKSMQPRHVRLALKCWEGYFYIASIHALTQENDEAEQVSTVDILESYMRPDSILVIGSKQQAQDAGNSTPGQRVAELQNLKVIMLTLALQMLANGIEMTQDQINRLKYLVLIHLGFKNAKLEFVNGKLDITSIGDFEYIPDDFTQNMMMISCLGNLKRVLDAPIYLKPSNNAEPEQEEELAGGYFVDVVLELFNSSVDMSTLSHLMLKSWIELLLIIVYKHKIEEKHNNQLEERLVSAMRKASELLSKDITEENKQLIIEVSTTLLRRAPMLTVNILGKYIITLGKLLTKLENNSSSSLVMSAKIFLRTAFLSFARNGLFVLIFKNQSVADETNTELDMFRVLREIIKDEVIPSEDENAEPDYLRVEPIRDVMNQLFKFTNSKIVSTVLYNLNRYVELDNPLYAKHLIHPVRNFLKHVINKCGPKIESFVKVLAAYNAIIEVSPSGTINVFGEVILDEIKAFYKGARNRLNRDTLVILLQLVLWDMQPSAHLWFKNIEQRIKLNFTNQPRKPFFSNVSEFLFEDCITFLENPPIIKQYSKQDFKVGVCASQLAVAMSSQKYELLKKVFLWQKPTDSRRTIRLLNWIFLGILKADSSEGLITIIYDFQDNISDLLSIALKSPLNDFEAGDVNYLYTPSGELAYQSFVLVKIWTILCLQNSEPKEKSKVSEAPRAHQRLGTNLTMTERRFWNFIWPNIRKQLISVIDENNILPNGIPYWEMFMDLITFLHLIGSDIVMLYSQEWCTLLDSLINENEEENREFHHKIKQARSMFDDPPLMMQQEM
ncbi:14612_t:CDS:10 [Funneliformis caledonium]|uniref:14612_t:CDS:1 n=1 Tax=Funneliformis caledonium TaxID=1117310 RepID=A0A9N8WFF1_9GLOM|nr:14612_t:CDS:10 [Funneliformis caledonium]